MKAMNNHRNNNLSIVINDFINFNIVLEGQQRHKEHRVSHGWNINYKETCYSDKSDIN